jgi:hypothetical protein
MTASSPLATVPTSVMSTIVWSMVTRPRTGQRTPLMRTLARLLTERGMPSP